MRKTNRTAICIAFDISAVALFMLAFVAENETITSAACISALVFVVASVCIGANS